MDKQLNTTASPTNKYLVSNYLVIGGVLLFLPLALAAHSYSYFSWDLSITHAAQQINSPGFYQLMRLVSLPGDHALVAFLIIVFSSLTFLAFKQKQAAYFLIACGLGEVALNTIIKWLVHRPRPTALLIKIMVIETTPSFPSGHVMHYTAFYLFLAFLIYKLCPIKLLKWCLISPSIILVALIGLSRIYLGAHWASDVLGSYLAGGIWLIFIIRRFSQKMLIK